MHWPSCPLLPEIDVKVGPDATRRHGSERGADYYLAALHYAQSQWRHAKPAQAILQLNKAWTADLTETNDDVLAAWPAPYRALRWMLEQPRRGAFLGNPVRHFQHLATRVTGPRRVIRGWRAWACFHLAKRCLPAAEFPRDEVQLLREGVWIPGVEAVAHALAKHGWPGECAAWWEAIGKSAIDPFPSTHARA